VHIELTDHLRCPHEHAEAFLVLLPDQMDQRRVVAGHLGCPVCGWSTAWTDSVPDFGGGWCATGQPPFDAAGAHAMLGIGGPGGWVALAGNAAALAGDLTALLPGVLLVAVNPPAAIAPTASISVLRSDAWPLKSHSMRGIILGADAAHWREPAISSTLPGLRTIGVGAPPDTERIRVLADAGGVWVAVTG
jgi:hypothetical protein